MDTRKELMPGKQEQGRESSSLWEENGRSIGMTEEGRKQGQQNRSREMRPGDSGKKEKKPNMAVRFFRIVFKYLKIIFRPLFKLLGFLFQSVFILCVLALLAVIFIGVYKIYPMYSQYKQEAVAAVSKSTLDTFRLQESSFIYDRQGHVIAKLTKDEDSDYLPFESIPEDAINAFVAIEDRTYWENSGYDLRGIVRVAFNYFKTEGEEMHGASTITQQLARNRFLTREISIERKAKEILISMELTKKYSKEEIMEFYVNDISFANTFYGLQSAAKGYFGKNASELSLSQIAYLCAIPNSPSYYNPYRHPENALKRRNKILNDMLELGYITQEDYNIAIKEEIVIQKAEYEFRNYETTYAIECAVRYLMWLDGFEFRHGFTTYEERTVYDALYEDAYAAAKDKLYTGGYRIYTSLDPDKQRQLQQAVDEVLTFEGNMGENGIYELQGAATVVDNRDGKVVAIVGGREQEADTYNLNRAFQGYRQPGSTIKPLIVYAPALDNGYSADSPVKNISVDAAKAKGADIASLSGESMSLRSAVEKSRNGVAWWLYNEITPEVGMGYLTKMSFNNIVPDDYYMASALGGFTYGVTTEEMAGAYSALANNGIYREPTCIMMMRDREGNNIYREKAEIEVYGQYAASTMVDIMKGVIKSGTAKSMGWRSSIEAAGKTGTTNNSKDGWFCGITPYYSIAVWVGYDQPRRLSNLWGATYPASIWKKAMTSMIEGLPPAEFGEPIDQVDFTAGTYVAGDGNYLPGRADSEEISPGYTVGHYRRDHTLADEAQRYIDQMAGADEQTRQALGNRARELVNQIYGTTLRGKMNQALNAVSGP
ncbi:transglycosylase domain-containing protein [Lachnospiraceae bacterium 62-35]